MRIEQLLDMYGIPYAQRGDRHWRHGWANIRCPYCCSDSYKLGIGVDQLGGYCWSCGNKSAWEAIKKVCPRVRTEHLKEVWKNKKRLPGKPVRDRGTLVEPQTRPLTADHKEYLLGRGFDPEALESLWGLRTMDSQWIGKQKFDGEIYIPIDMFGKQMAWQVRHTEAEARNRYRAPPDKFTNCPIKETLYGWDKTSHTVIVVEGVTDVWRVGPGAVATYGTSFTEEQVALLGMKSRRLICYDNEPLAQAKADALAEALGAFPGQTMVLELETGSDPGDAAEHELEDLRRTYLGT